MGNCLFDSLNRYIKESSSHALRLVLCQYILDHKDVFESFLKFEGYSTVDHYVKRMSRNGVDGDHAILAAAALKYNMKINVEMPNGKIFSEGQDDAEKVADIKWVPGHYAVPRPRTTTIRNNTVEAQSFTFPSERVQTQSVSRLLGEQVLNQRASGLLVEQVQTIRTSSTSPSLQSVNMAQIRPHRMTPRARNYLNEQQKNLKKQQTKCPHCRKTH